MAVEKITLKSGLRIVHERLDHVRSCAFGVWVQSGSRHEPEALCGVSHFIEHMLFKGTDTLSAAALAEAFDGIGGQVNAFTTKENTCYYVRVLDTHLQTAAGLIADMFFRSAFAEKETDLERGVIVEEIGMYEDTPEDLCNELLFAEAFKGASLARPILGTQDSLKGITGDVLRSYRAKAYTPQNTLISISGSYSEADLQAIIALFDIAPPGTPPVLEGASYSPGVVLRKKDIEQNHLIVGFPGLPTGHDKRFTMQVMNNVLGAGMSSRLFQKIRETHGLCYTIYSFAAQYIGAGLFGIYTALGRETEGEALRHIRDEVLRFKAEGITAEELSRTQEQLKSTVLMGLEGTTSRMSAIARNELTYGRYIPEDEIVAGLDAVTLEDVTTLARETLDFGRMTFAAVGNIGEEAAYMGLLKG